MTNASPSGRGWAYTGTILGGTISVAANIGHSFIAPIGAPADWAPEPGAVGFAVAWPVVLFVAVEILARYDWPAGLWWKVVRFGGMIPVTLVAAFVSYRHLSGLLTHYGEDSLVSTFGPLAIDGLMVMATGALVASARARRALTAQTAITAPPSAAAPAAPTHTPAASIVTPRTVAPALAALAVPVVTPTPEPVAAVAALSGPPPTVITLPAPTTEQVTASATRAPHEVPVAPAATAAASAPTPVTQADAAPPIGKPVPTGMLTRARHLAQAHRAQTGEPITAGQLAARMRIDTRTAAQVLAVLDLDPTSPTKPTQTVNGHLVKATR